MKSKLLFISLAVLLAACNSNKKAASAGGGDIVTQPVGPAFNADSAYAFCEKQCSYGPRTMNSEAHEQCGEWLAGKLLEGMAHTVEEDKTEYVSKEDVLAGIDAGLKDVKAGRTRDARELLAELQ